MKRLLLLFALLVTGCAGSTSPGEMVAGTTAGAVMFVHDDARGVGCWYFVGSGDGGGIHCMPDSEYAR